MQTLLILTLTLLTLLLGTSLLAQPKTLVEWTFDNAGDLQGWTGANHVADVRAEDGAMQGRIMDWDPFMRSPQFEIPATPWQRVEFRLKTDCGGGGEVFWTNTTESPYSGFSPGKETFFNLIGDGEWHEYQLYPFWQSEGKIILLRLDLAKPAAADNGKKTFAVDWIRIVDLGTPATREGKPEWDGAAVAKWSAISAATVSETAEGAQVVTGLDPDGAILSEPLKLNADDGYWISVEMAVDKGATGFVRWVCSGQSGLQSAKTILRPDGKFHTYNVDASGTSRWTGDILMLGLTPSVEPGAKATIRRVVVAADPQGPPDVEAGSAGLENALSRAGALLPFVIGLMNRGGAPAEALRVASVKLPGGVTVEKGDGWDVIPALQPFEPSIFRMQLSAKQAIKGGFEITLAGPGAPEAPITGEMELFESLSLPKADYVPEPKPVDSDYEVGALYFPGWPGPSAWEPIQRVAPERRPVLGWYDESNPECVDWQIKWAAENGLKFFLVDWYWSAGGISLDHWVKAFYKSRYKTHLKWAMMWANHNAPNTHSEEDQRKVTQYWIDNYFNTPEYYRINDMPVVMIWSVGNMENDMAGKGGAKRLLEISQEMAKAAGYKGIWFVAMKWGEADTDPQIIQALADKGFDMTSIYHYMDSGGKATNPYRFPFELCAEASYPFWKAWHEAGILPFLPNLATGWDSRPWHGDGAQVIYGRTVPLFKRICEDAKRFADETGIKRMVLAPLNEWGEGSYAEPCKEFGFGMYEAVRDTFCKQPGGGWPQNFGPADVGLGPYDFPTTTLVQRHEWDFTDGSQGWGPMMGLGTWKAAGGELSFVNSGSDPAIQCGLRGIQAGRYPTVTVRMRVEGEARPGDQLQLFWATASAGVTEASSVKVDLIYDGQFHDYVLPVGESPRWRGTIRSFRMDPGSSAGAKVTIERIRLDEKAK